MSLFNEIAVDSPDSFSPMNQLQPYTPKIIKLCETHRVKSLYAFGSVLINSFNSTSDIDLIVDFDGIDVDGCGCGAHRWY